jgi:hypothetical protein
MTFPVLAHLGHRRATPEGPESTHQRHPSKLPPNGRKRPIAAVRVGALHNPIDQSRPRSRDGIAAILDLIQFAQRRCNMLGVEWLKALVQRGVGR